MPQWIRPSLVQIMAFGQFGAQPLSELILIHCQLEPYEQIFCKIVTNMQNLSFNKMHLNMSSVKCRVFCISLNVFNQQISWRFLSVGLPLLWRHNGHDCIPNHQPHHCLLSYLFGRRSKKTSKLRVTGLCVGNSPGTGEFPAQMASNAENVSIWWRHHVLSKLRLGEIHRNSNNAVFICRNDILVPIYPAIITPTSLE